MAVDQPLESVSGRWHAPLLWLTLPALPPMSPGSCTAGSPGQFRNDSRRLVQLLHQAIEEFGENGRLSIGRDDFRGPGNRAGDEEGADGDVLDLGRLTDPRGLLGSDPCLDAFGSSRHAVL